MKKKKSLISPFIDIVKFRRILYSTTFSEIQKKYAGSLLGVIWAFLYPLLFLAVYATVYAAVFKVSYNELDTTEYIAVIFCGLIPFLGFSESISTGVGSVTANAGLIKNTMFPIELVPVRTVFTAQLTHISGMGILLVMIIFIGRMSVSALLCIPIWLLQVMFEIGLVWILSSINVLVRDLQNIVSVVMIMLMMLSPIAYPADSIPETYARFLKGNPLFYFIVANQDILMYGKVPDSQILIPMIILGIGFFIVGYQFFIRMKRVFVDNV